MLLVSADGAEFDLVVLGYQFSEADLADTAAESRGWDANWLIARGRVRTAAGSRWGFEDACLTTWEARQLGRWLEQLTDSPDGLEPIAFTEPALVFSSGAVSAAGFRSVEISLSHSAAAQNGQGVSTQSMITIGSSVEAVGSAARQWQDGLAVFSDR